MFHHYEQFSLGKTWKTIFQTFFFPSSTLVKLENFNTVFNSLMNNSKIIWVHIWGIIHLQYNVFWIFFGTPQPPFLSPLFLTINSSFFIFEYFEDFLLYFPLFSFYFSIFPFVFINTKTQKFRQGKFKHTKQIQHSYIYIFIFMLFKCCFYYFMDKE